MYHEKSDGKRKYVKIIVIIVILAAVIFVSWLSYTRITAHMTEQNIDVIENTVRKSAVQCYAVEGVYPSNVEYLEENYGLIINHEKYIVSYEAFSSNLMPEITVLVKEESAR